MTLDEESIPRRYLRFRQLEDLLDVVERRSDNFGERNIVVYVNTEDEVKQNKFDINQQIVRMGTEVQDLRNLMNKYLKVDVRENALAYFKQIVSEIPEVKEVYVQQETQAVVFWIFYEKGERVKVLQKMVDAECHLENMFANLNFDFRVLSDSSAGNRLKSSADLLYHKGA